MGSVMKSIVGLGNPGKHYQKTRHSVGFSVVDRLAEEAGLRWKKDWRRGAWVAQGSLEEQAVILVKPRTFMNQSGQVLKAVVTAYQLELSEMIVVHDDLDLPLGKLRLRQKGSAGGHRGVLSLMAALGTGEFPRLRIGIGRPPPGGDVVSYVLSPFTPEEQKEVSLVLSRAVAALRVFLRAGLEEAMRLFNRR